MKRFISTGSRHPWMERDRATIACVCVKEPSDLVTGFDKYVKKVEKLGFSGLLAFARWNFEIFVSSLNKVLNIYTRTMMSNTGNNDSRERIAIRD
jgi:hypothetical protein